MNRSLLMCLSLPFAIALTGCTGDDSKGMNDDEIDSEDSISSLGTDTDTAETLESDTAEETMDGETATEAETGDGPSCGEVSIEPSYVPPNVMLVVDASGSMVKNSWDHDGDPETDDQTRWNTLHSVVDAVTSNFGAAMNAGVQRFPSAGACPDATPMTANCYNVDACITATMPEVNVGIDNAAAILAAIPGPDAGVTEVVGATPASLGITSAANHLLAQNEAVPRYIVLITDGAANCDLSLVWPGPQETYDIHLPTTVESFYDDGITTFVVGIDIVNALTGGGPDGSPEANAFEKLNEVALAGGAPKNMGLDPEKFFNSTNQQELLDAIELILGEVTNCTIDLAETDAGAPDVTQIPFVSFESNGMLVPKVDDCDTEDGWTWLEEGQVVIFCGTYCENFKNGTTTFDGTYGCPPVD